MDLEKIKQEFDKLTTHEQFEWLLSCEFKDKFTVFLDNDNTSILFDDDTNADYLITLKQDIGNRRGIIYLLASAGIKADFV